MNHTFLTLLPEAAMFAGTCLTMIVGLSRDPHIRNQTWLIVMATLVLAGLLAANSPATSNVFPMLMPFAKSLIAVVGLLLMLLAAGTVDRDEERQIAAGRPFDALRTNRAEFWALFLFSLTGTMLCAGAPNLIWLFLALELVSLPTYVMVVMSTRGTASQEAGVKYFFLGALGAAFFLYGFALLYGGTGTTSLAGIASHFAGNGINDIAACGMVLSIIGVAFKIAAVPMHFYTADVYQGAASPISAFLAFTPKTAGFITLILLVGTMGWNHAQPGTQAGDVAGAATAAGHSLPEFARITLWVLAALTMTVGNVLALVQHSVKRILAYSSIAHSGYMLVGLVAGPGPDFTSSGVSAILFYLLCYGVMNVGVFAVLACLERAPAAGSDADPAEADHIDDIKGLCRTRPVLGWCMVICSLSLLGLPFTLGFWGKVPLFTAGIAAGEITLVIILGLNSAIAALYYLRLAALPLLEAPADSSKTLRDNPFWSRRLAAMLSAAGVVILVFLANGPMESSHAAARYVRATPAPITPIQPPAHTEDTHADAAHTPDAH